MRNWPVRAVVIATVLAVATTVAMVPAHATGGPGNADLSVTVADSPDPVDAGSDLVYTITVGNAGPDAAASASWTDALPSGTTFVSMPAVTGWSCTTPAVGANGTVTCSNASFAATVSDIFTLTVAVGAGVADGTVLSNTATVSSSTGEPNAANNTDTATTTVAASADLSVTKTDSPDPVTPGTDVTYTITATNNGPSDADTVSMSDTLPASETFVSLTSPGAWSCTTPAVGATGTISCSIATLLAGDNGAFTLVAHVDPATADASTLSNTATVSTATADPNAANDSATAATTASASADLAITKTGSPDPVTAGNNITYSITATNNGPSDAQTVTVNDSLPAGETFVSLASPSGWSCTTPAVGANGTVSCSIATLAAAATGAFTLVVNVDSGVADATVLSNTATISSPTADPTPGNNTATATNTVGTSADVRVTMTDSPDPVVAPGTITYSITVVNDGPSAAPSVSLTDTIGSGLTFEALASAGGWSCTTPPVKSAGTVSCTNPSLASGATSTFALVVNVPGTAGGTTVSNTVAVDSPIDSTAGNNSATAATTATTRQGYYFVDSNGRVYGQGRPTFGDLSGAKLNAPIVGMVVTPTGNGYWLAGADGGVFTFGDARFFGSLGSLKLNKPIVGIAATPTGNGYWLVASDGGVFTFGDARFFGSLASVKLNTSVVGLAATPSGNGYWLVAADGGVFTFGDAVFFGSKAGHFLSAPVVGMAVTPSGNGYWLVAADGGVFTFGDAPFFGSMAGIKLNQPVVGIAPTVSGRGYWLGARDGGVFSFGDAGFSGTPSPSAPIVAIA